METLDANHILENEKKKKRGKLTIKIVVSGFRTFPTLQFPNSSL